MRLYPQSFGYKCRNKECELKINYGVTNSETFIEPPKSHPVCQACQQPMMITTVMFGIEKLKWWRNDIDWDKWYCVVDDVNVPREKKERD